MSIATLCERRVVTASVLSVPPTPDVTRTLDVRGFNALQVSLVVKAISGSLTAKVQGSDDLENWTDLTTLGSSIPLGAAFPAVTALSVAYVRLTFIMSDVGELAIVGVTCNLANL